MMEPRDFEGFQEEVAYEHAADYLAEQVAFYKFQEGEWYRPLEVERAELRNFLKTIIGKRRARMEYPASDPDFYRYQDSDVEAQIERFDRLIKEKLHVEELG